MTAQEQLAYRSEKASGVSYGPSTYGNSSNVRVEETGIRSVVYSPNGKWLAVATLDAVNVYEAETEEIVRYLPVLNAQDIAFSPSGKYISMWEKFVKEPDGSPKKNVTVWNLDAADQTGPIYAYTAKAMIAWWFQFSADESIALRMATNEVQAYKPGDDKFTLQGAFRNEGCQSFSLSPGVLPKVALFTPERKGNPGALQIFDATRPGSPHLFFKALFKGDSITFKWQSQGSHLLALISTDHDATGKSYYGETKLHLVAASGANDAIVQLDKEGSIHDFEWCPNTKQFAVSYGYMPSKNVVFDTSLKPVLDCGSLPRNFVSFNPQGTLLALAGFGNLAGEIDIWDRASQKKIASFHAPNTSICRWTATGRILLCATTSPRLRVDNGWRLLFYDGTLLDHVSMDELYAVVVRPQPGVAFRVGDKPSPSQAAVEASATAKPQVAKGSYRPPHARNRETPSIFKREDQGGVPLENLKSKFTKTRFQKAPPGSAEDWRNKMQEKRASLQKEAEPEPEPENKASALTPEEKKRRVILKKLNAIDLLKIKQANGEPLELTQLSKIDAEADLRKQLEEFTI